MPRCLKKQKRAGTDFPIEVPIIGKRAWWKLLFISHSTLDKEHALDLQRLLESTRAMRSSQPRRREKAGQENCL
jgi:hypothetical protein